MRFAIITTAYEQFLADFYDADPTLRSAPFATQRQAYYDTLFASSDFYAHAIRDLGHECEEFILNAAPMQRAWLSETAANGGAERAHGATRCGDRPDPPRTSMTVDASPWEFTKALLRPLWRRSGDPSERPYRVVLEQVKAIRPDVLYIQAIMSFSTEELIELKRHAGRLIGEHAATQLPDSIDYRRYDLIVSSFPPTVDELRRRGVRAEYVRLGFDPRVARRVPETARDRGATFVGSLLGVHRSRLQFLEAVAAAMPSLEVYAGSGLRIDPASPLFRRLHGPVWGRGMYGMLRRSVATLNHHGDVPPFANNMRLYEATGMGCLLITDWKENLAEIFEPEKEVVTYRDAEECVDKLRFYLAPANATACAEVARAGERRTLAEHTYTARMRDILRLIAE